MSKNFGTNIKISSPSPLSMPVPRPAHLLCMTNPGQARARGRTLGWATFPWAAHHTLDQP